MEGHLPSEPKYLNLSDFLSDSSVGLQINDGYKCKGAGRPMKEKGIGEVVFEKRQRTDAEMKLVNQKMAATMELEQPHTTAVAPTDSKQRMVTLPKRKYKALQKRAQRLEKRAREAERNEVASELYSQLKQSDNNIYLHCNRALRNDLDEMRRKVNDLRLSVNRLKNTYERIGKDVGAGHGN